ncbi:hypothetical protein LOD99_12556 [Oopsacas minuta]|uniref:Ubiquitin-like domain-containing protein n=1 Tax=Oopsacas minuta TaxID=111878 RepID=A0AAV7JCH4_9METZ|nr:hypothetical protein LOD99_12556 [Oopsacas minuta]
MADSEGGEGSPKPRVSIRALSGRTCHFDVKEDTTVEQLKHIIAGDMEVPVERQRLLFQGKILTDKQLLKAAGCFNKVIHLVKRAELPANPPVPPSSTTSASTTPAGPAPGNNTAGVVFGGFPFIGPHQIFNNVWNMTPPSSTVTSTNSASTTTTTTTSTSTPTGPGNPHPAHGPRSNRGVPGALWETRHLLQLCGNTLDRFDRGESIAPQDPVQHQNPGPGPSVSVASSLLGDLYTQMAAVFQRLLPLFREEAQFLQEDRVLEDEERVRLERVSSCIRAVLERLHVCEVHLLNVSVSCSQAPPRTVQATPRNRRRVVIQAPHHMAHVQVNINHSNQGHPNVPPPGTAPNSAPAGTNPDQPPPNQEQSPPNPPLQPLTAPSPTELTNIFVQALSSILPGAVNPQTDGSMQTSAVPHTITGEAVIIQNGLMNRIPIETGSGATPHPLSAGLPQGLSIIQLARSLYPGFIDDPGDDIFSRLILVLCNALTVEQLRDVVQGRVECLQAMYQQIKEFVLSVLATEANCVEAERRLRGGKLIAESAVENMEGLIESLPPQEGLNMKRTFINFFQIHFHTAITLILDPRNQDIEASNTENRFGKVIWGWCQNMLCELSQLIDVLARAGGTDIHSVLEATLRSFILANEAAGDIPVDIIRVVFRENREKINSLIRSSRLTEIQIKDKYCINITPEPSSLPQLASEFISASTDWMSQEWKDCIQEDTQIQTSQQTCFSNSYMNYSGLTDNKDQKVACTVEDMLCDTLTMSINSSQVQPITSVDEVMHDVRQNSTLKKRYNEFIDSNLNKRIRSDPNHSAERFPKSAGRYKSDDQ